MHVDFNELHQMRLDTSNGNNGKVHTHLYRRFKFSVRSACMQFRRRILLKELQSIDVQGVNGGKAVCRWIAIKRCWTLEKSDVQHYRRDPVGLDACINNEDSVQFDAQLISVISCKSQKLLQRPNSYSSTGYRTTAEFSFRYVQNSLQYICVLVWFGKLT